MYIYICVYTAPKLEHQYPGKWSSMHQLLRGAEYELSESMGRMSMCYIVGTAMPPNMSPKGSLMSSSSNVSSYKQPPQRPRSLIHRTTTIDIMHNIIRSLLFVFAMATLSESKHSTCIVHLLTLTHAPYEHQSGGASNPGPLDGRFGGAKGKRFVFVA